MKYELIPYEDIPKGHDDIQERLDVKPSIPDEYIIKDIIILLQSEDISNSASNFEEIQTNIHTRCA